MLLLRQVATSEVEARRRQNTGVMVLADNILLLQVDAGSNTCEAAFALTAISLQHWTWTNNAAAENRHINSCTSTNAIFSPPATARRKPHEEICEE